MIQTIGIHRVSCGDVMEGIAELMAGDRADIMYSDPPWGDGNVKYWATMNRKMTGQVVEPPPLADFLSAVFATTAFVDGYLLLEYGVRWREMIETRGAAAGFDRHGIVPLQYRSGGKLYPLDLHLFARPGYSYPPGYQAHVANTVGYQTLRRAVPPLAEALRVRKIDVPILLDPCCGLGYSAQAAVDNGMAFRGNELNATRLEKTVERLR